MNEFGRYHPIVNMTYFAFAITSACLFLHPVMLILSLVTSFAYAYFLKGVGQIKVLCAVIPLAFINPAFNHEGVTILTYLPSGNPLTLESIYFGIACAFVSASVILLLGCFCEVMTSDKIVYLLGKISPSLSLFISVSLRFVPEFIRRFSNVAKARKCMGRGISDGGVFKKIKNVCAVFSATVTWSLENTIDTADSMRSRGYGLTGRTAFSIFRFSNRDKKALVCIILLSAYVTAGAVVGAIEFRYLPFAEGAPFSLYGLSVFTAYFVLLALPLFIEVLEVKKWKSIK